MEKLLALFEEKLGAELATEAVVNEVKAHIDLLVTEKVQERLAEEKTKLEESMAQDAREYKQELIEQIDSYMDYAVTEFFKENKVAIESEFKVKAADELIEKICTVLEANHFAVEPAKNDGLKKLEAKVAQLEGKLSRSVRENMDLKKEQFEYEKAIKFTKLSEGLSKVKAEKALDLLEGVEFKNLSDFVTKAKIVIEKVKGSAAPAVKPASKTIEEKIDPNSSDIDKYL